MKERSILYRPEMVRAKLAHRKTQTRRIIDRVAGLGKIRQFEPSTTPGYDFHFRDRRGLWQDFRLSELLERCPYGKPGDRLWGRETWCQAATDEGTFKYNAEGNLDNTCCHYMADGYEVMHIDGEETESGQPRSPWVPSIHMPRWASRILDEITEIRVERVQDITNEDAIAEGILPIGRSWFNYYKDADEPFCGDDAPIVSYQSLWESINGPGSWDRNDYVWVIVTRPIEPATPSAGLYSLATNQAPRTKN